jgi:hypothetical protein
MLCITQRKRNGRGDKYFEESGVDGFLFLWLAGFCFYGPPERTENVFNIHEFIVKYGRASGLRRMKQQFFKIKFCYRTTEVIIDHYTINTGSNNVID